MTITAYIKYRDHLDLYEIAVKFCNIEFYGQDDETWALENTWNHIKYANYDKYDAQAKEEEIRIEKIEADIEAKQQMLSDFTLIGKITNRAQYKKLYQDIEDTREILEGHKKEHKKLEERRFKTTYMLIRDAHEFLAREGFTHKSMSHNENKNITTEVWTRG